MTRNDETKRTETVPHDVDSILFPELVKGERANR